MLNLAAEDECCHGPLTEALLSGDLDARESWECQKCGCEWSPRMVAGVRFWEPHPVIMVWR
jgi:hypothetical protein